MSEEIAVYSVIVSDDAKAMLSGHVTFLAQVSIPAANRLIDNFEAAVKSLSQFPQRCAIFEAKQTSRNYRRCLFGRYAILFVIEEKPKIVRIRYILDMRRDNK